MTFGQNLDEMRTMSHHNNMMAIAILVMTIVYLATVGFDTNTFEYAVILSMLLIALGLAYTVTPSTSSIFEMFESGLGLDSVQRINDSIATLAATSKAMQAVLMTGMDKWASSMRDTSKDAKSKTQAKANGEEGKGDDGESQSQGQGQSQAPSPSPGEMVQLTPELYAKDPMLMKENGEIDKKKYKAMTAVYASMHYLLCTFKTYDEGMYKTLCGM
jgi:hypothetical protein